MDRLIRNQVVADKRERMEAHLRNCARCTAEYEEFREDAVFLDREKCDLMAVLDASGTFTSTVQVPKNAASEHLPRIEGYDVQRLIGRGGMAAVYEAVQTKLNRTVALKLLSAVAGSAQPSLVTRFRREATAAAKLHHTHIIPIYDFGESRDGYYYAMELIQGPTVKEMIQRLASASAPNISATEIAALVHSDASKLLELASGTSDSTGDSSATGSSSSTANQSRNYFRQVAQWMMDVASALHFAHMSGVIHRDRAGSSSTGPKCRCPSGSTSGVL